MLSITRCFTDPTDCDLCGTDYKVVVRGEHIDDHDPKATYVNVSIPDGSSPGDENFPPCPDCTGKLVFGAPGGIVCSKCKSEFSPED